MGNVDFHAFNLRIEIGRLQEKNASLQAENERLKEENKIGEIRQTRFADLADNAEFSVIELKRLLRDIDNELSDGHYGLSGSYLPPKIANRITEALKKYPQLPPIDKIQALQSKIDRVREYCEHRPEATVYREKILDLLK